jgi:type II secretory pathway component PulK
VNRRIFSLDELADVPGMDRELLDAMRAYFSTQPMIPRNGRGGVNPNTAPPHVLGLICHGFEGEDCRLFGHDEVFDVMRLRDQLAFCAGSKPADSCLDFATELDLIGEAVFPRIDLRNHVFEINIEASYGATRACLSSIVRLGDKPDTLFYRMGC